MICLLLHTQLLIDNTNLIPIALHVIMSNLVYMHSYKNTCIIVCKCINTICLPHIRCRNCSMDLNGLIQGRKLHNETLNLNSIKI